MRKTKADPTGQRKNRLNSEKVLSARLAKAKSQVLAEFRKLKRTSRQVTPITNAATTVYEYEYLPDEMRAFVDSVVSTQLLQGASQQDLSGWYWEDEIEQPFRQGAAEEVRDFNQAIAAAIAVGVLSRTAPIPETTVENYLLSDNYRNDFNMSVSTGFNSIKGLSDETTAKVMNRINAGIASGKSPEDIAKDIEKRFNVAAASAARIAQTEVNAAYNDAKLTTTKALSKQTGLQAGVIHISALSSTTRDTHAARHGNAYTVEDQMQWWDEGANRINCKCTTISVLLTADGTLVDPDTREEIKAESDFFSNQSTLAA